MLVRMRTSALTMQIPSGFLDANLAYQTKSLQQILRA
jgi:hypothetical protein